MTYCCLIIIIQNSIGCRLLLISTKYSRMTNYMWMFAEGFYLHKLIASAFAEQKSLLQFYLIGWGIVKNAALYTNDSDIVFTPCNFSIFDVS